jgi:prefoldin subunit 5
MSKEQVIAQLQALEQQMADVHQRLAEINDCRNDTLEEVAQAIERMHCFGHDTIASFAIHIREMKR